MYMQWVGMGRKKLWAENINLTLPEGAKERMDAVLHPGENRLDMIRGAIDQEINRRERSMSIAKKSSASRKNRSA